MESLEYKPTSSKLDSVAPALPETEFPAPAEPEEEPEMRRIKDLPREVGVMLVSVGVAGMLLPGIMGSPAIIAGGLVLWPRAFGKLETWFERKYPDLHKKSLKQISRYLDDLERRFPESLQKKA